MHRLASFLQRNSSNDTISDSIRNVSESIESIDDQKISITKQEEFHAMVLKYINSNDNNSSDLYNENTLNCLKWFAKQSCLPSSIGKDLKLYLKKSLPIFASVYHKYHNQIINYYHFSFIINKNNQCLSLLQNYDYNNNNKKVINNSNNNPN
eukprot:147928_1